LFDLRWHRRRRGLSATVRELQANGIAATKVSRAYPSGHDNRAADRRSVLAGQFGAGVNGSSIFGGPELFAETRGECPRPKKPSGLAKPSGAAMRRDGGVDGSVPGKLGQYNQLVWPLAIRRW
jgi:hypothetical protein